MTDSTEILMVAELWKRRLEWLWKNSEITAYRDFDVEWLDKQIIEDEADMERARNVIKARNKR